MLDEEMDDIIRDAASQHYPSYDDKAWGKMERMLNKHLPQKGDNRKWMLLLSLLLLISAGAFFILYKTKKNTGLKSNTYSQNTTPQTADKENAVATAPLQKNTAGNNLATGSGNNNNQPISKPVTKQVDYVNTNVNNPSANSQKHNKISVVHAARINSHTTNGDIAEVNAEQTNKSTSLGDNNVTHNPIATPDKNKQQQTSSATPAIVNQPPTTSISDNNIKKPPVTTPVNSPSKKEITKSNTGNNLAFTLSAGPGFSYVGLSYLGKTTFSYGAGVAYNIGKKFMLRTGFYVTQKIYTANPADYHPPAGNWTYYVDMQKVNANCRVYEIPLSLAYTIKQAKKHSWYVSAGLSSYLMKKETYNYLYKGPLGQEENSQYVVDNQNKHIFSILDFSGGYRYNVNSRVSLMAEPFIELPMDGIGFGKIKLNSGGLLFTVSVKPFAHK